MKINCLSGLSRLIFANILLFSGIAFSGDLETFYRFKKFSKSYNETVLIKMNSKKCCVSKTDEPECVAEDAALKTETCGKLKKTFEGFLANTSSCMTRQRFELIAIPRRSPASRVSICSADGKGFPQAESLFTDIKSELK